MRHLSRRIVGAALYVASDKVTIKNISDALNEQKIAYELPTAAAKGLMLYKIRYK